MRRARVTRNSHQAHFGSKQISFLPAPDFNPKLPPKNTLTYVAWRILLEGKRITSFDFQNRTESQRLAAYIYALTKIGWPVQVNYIAVTLDGEPKSRIVSQYYFDEELVKKFKKYLGGRNE